MHRLSAVASIIAATWALSACGVQSQDTGATRTSQDAPQLLADLQSLPDGHPPLPGYTLRPTLPEGHRPYLATSRLQPCPKTIHDASARVLRETAVGCRMDEALRSPPDLIST